MTVAGANNPDENIKSTVVQVTEVGEEHKVTRNVIKLQSRLQFTRVIF